MDSVDAEDSESGELEAPPPQQFQEVHKPSREDEAVTSAADDEVDKERIRTRVSEDESDWQREDAEEITTTTTQEPRLGKATLALPSPSAATIGSSAPSSAPSSPRDDNNALQIATAFLERSRNQNNVKTHELKIKVAPNESSKNILDVAERAIVNSSVLEGRLIHREDMRSFIEVGARPVTIEVVLSLELDRCVLVKVPESVPDQLFEILRDAYASQVHLTTRVQDNLRGLEEEHEELIDGRSVKSSLDPDYVALVKKVMHQRSEKDLTTFAAPLERRARDDEKRVAKLQTLLAVKYAACHLPLPAPETPPPLSSFPLVKNDPPATLILRENATPREVDAQLKMAIRRDLHSESLARQERKKREVLARAEVCERNRNQLVSVLSNSRAALDMDLDLMAKLGVSPPQVALCRVGCFHAKKPGFLVVTHQLIIFEAVGFFGFRFGNNLRIDAHNCRSVMKGRTSLGLVDSLCVRMDSHQEYVFYLAAVDETNEQLDSVFELIWQVLRMNRWRQ